MQARMLHSVVPRCRYDPSAHIPESIETESARVAFLSSVCAAVASKARIPLKTKALYAADGRAVKEMLKLARVLYKCVSLSGGVEPRAGVSTNTY